MVKTGNTVYLAYPAFQLYAEKGQNVLREIITQGLRELLPEPTLVTNLPAQGLQTVQRQQAEGRTVVHLLYANPIRRGDKIEVIEDLIPINNVTMELRVADSPKRVYLAPQDTDLPFTLEGGVLKATVPTLLCHQMVVVE